MAASTRLSFRTLSDCIAPTIVAATIFFCSPSSALAQSETVEYYATDAIGSIRVVFDANGNELARADYLPFGEELSSSEGLPAERFTGQARDAEVGMDYFNARMLQVRFGRMTTPDPLAGDLLNPQSWNRYAYVLGNPVNFTDPTGLLADSGWRACAPELDRKCEPYDVLVQMDLTWYGGFDLGGRERQGEWGRGWEAQTPGSAPNPTTPTPPTQPPPSQPPPPPGGTTPKNLLDTLRCAAEGAETLSLNSTLKSHTGLENRFTAAVLGNDFADYSNFITNGIGAAGPYVAGLLFDRTKDRLLETRIRTGVATFGETGAGTTFVKRFGTPIAETTLGWGLSRLFLGKGIYDGLSYGYALHLCY